MLQNMCFDPRTTTDFVNIQGKSAEMASLSTVKQELYQQQLKVH